MRIVVILSTYNGEKHLREQLDSILSQTVLCDVLLIRDDGSTDTTKQILQEYQHRYPSIQILEDTLGNIGINPSYYRLIQCCANLRPDYIMFSDQDDIWLPEKTEKLLQKILQLDIDKPALVFSDVTVVDTYLNIIAPSYERFQKITPQDAKSLKSLLFYSPALGCTMMFNYALLTRIPPFAKNYPNPDKWVLLVASIFGKVDHVDDITLWYRQHAHNVTGACVQRGIRRKILHFKNARFIKKRFQTAVAEARLLIQSIPNLPPSEKKVIEQFIRMFTENYVTRLKNYRYFWQTPPHWSRKLGLFCSLFFRYG